MACGVPVVAFAVGGLATVIADGAGVAVPSGDVGALAAATEALLADESLRRAQAEAGRAAAIARYGAEAHVAALAGHYARVLAQ